MNIATDSEAQYERMKGKVHDELKKHFRPEFLNRIDEIVVFKQLSQDEIVKMVDLLIGRVGKNLAAQNMGIELTENAKNLLLWRAPRARRSTTTGGRCWPTSAASQTPPQRPAWTWRAAACSAPSSFSWTGRARRP